MPTYEKATIRGGGSVEFEVSNPAGSGGMKQVFFAKGRQQVVAFFHNAAVDSDREERLQKVIGSYNPTRDGQAHAEYWRQVFCWPTAMVDHPVRGIGFLLPAYPDCFFFQQGEVKGKEKIGLWFNCIDRKTGRAMRHSRIHASERGNLRSIMLSMVEIARAVRRMHNAGLAHSDLSENNVLVDPTTGRALIIDVDSLVVTGLHPPDVIGTPGYIAPEVMATKRLAVNDPRRRHPNAETDKHALAVMLYKYLLERHPLEGRRRMVGLNAEDEDEMLFGSKALYAEHRTDHSNRPAGNQWIPASALGPQLEELFHRAFVEGLTEPTKRPMPGEWVQAMLGALDNMAPCENPTCPHRWFVVTGTERKPCPACGHRSTMPLVRLNFEREGKPGWFRPEGSLVLSLDHGGQARTRIYRHHIERNLPRGPGEDTTPLAEIVHLETPHQGYYLENKALPNLGVRILGGVGLHYRHAPVPCKTYLMSNLEICFDIDRSVARDKYARAWAQVF